MPIYEYLCTKCRTQFELRRPISEADKTAMCPKCNSEAEKLISNFASKTGSYLQVPSEPFRKGVAENKSELGHVVDGPKESNPNRWRVDTRTILLTLVFMLFLLLLVTLLMPRSGVIGVSLQVLAGLIFIIDQTWRKILESDFPGKLRAALDQTAFQRRAPLFAIPVIVPLFLVAYYRFGATPRPWFEAFFSISMATAFANFFYLATVVTVGGVIQRIQERRGKATDRAPLGHPLRTNFILLVASFVLLIALLIAGTLAARLLSGSSIPAIVRFALDALILTVMMFLGYIMFLSLLYFGLLLLLKVVVTFKKIRVSLIDADKDFTRRMIWAFLLACWLWGGVLLAIDTWFR